MTFDQTRVAVATKTLTGKALAWVVAAAMPKRMHGLTYSLDVHETTVWSSVGCEVVEFAPQDDWSQCGRLIDEYQINFKAAGAALDSESEAYPVVAFVGRTAREDGCSYAMGGQNHMEAACRAVAASFFGDSVEVPAVLMQPGAFR